MNHPGRLAHLTIATYDPRITDQLRANHVRLAFPPGYDPDQVQQGMRDARELRDEGRGVESAQLLRSLIDDPPMKG